MLLNSPIDENSFSPPTSSYTVMSKTNISSKLDIPLNSEIENNNFLCDSVSRSQEPIDIQPPFKKKKYNTILSSINESRVQNLTPQKKKLYFISKSQRHTISKLKNYLTISNKKLKKPLISH